MDHNCHFGVKVPEGYRDDWAGETDENRLLEVEPTPLTDSDVPLWLRDTENVVVDQEPLTFYRKFKRGLLILNIIALVLLAILFIVYNTVNSTLSNSSIILNDINDIKLTETGIYVGGVDAEVHIKRNRYFDWTKRFNNTQFFIDGPVDIIMDGSKLMSIEFVPKPFNFQINDGVWRVGLEDLNFNTDGRVLKQFLSQKKGKVTVKAKMIFKGKTIPLNKNLSVDQQSLQGLLSSVLEILLSKTKIGDFNDLLYEENIGITCNLGMKVPVISKLSTGLAVVGFTINDIFYKFLEVEFSTHFRDADLKLTIFNVDEVLVKEGIVEDLVHRFLNGDENMHPVTFTIFGGQIEFAPKWLSEFWKDFTMDIAVKLSNLKYYGQPFKFPKTIPMELEELHIRPQNGIIQTQNRLYMLLNTLFESYEVTTNGHINCTGLGLQFKQHTSKVKSSPLSVVGGKILLDVNDPTLGRGAVNELLHGKNGIHNMSVSLVSSIASSFYNGELAIKKSVVFDTESLSRIINGTRGTHDQVELLDMKILEKSSTESKGISFFINTLIKLPIYIGRLSNGFEEIALRVGFNDSYVLDISLLQGSGNDGYMPIDLIVSTNTNNPKTLSDFETLVSRFISGLPVNVTGSSVNNDDETIPECDKNINELLNGIEIPLNISIDNISGKPDGGSFFIRDTTMHVVSREVEMILFNPVSNSEIIIEILEGQAIREGYIIGYLQEPVTWVVEPGIWQSPRAKVEFANTGSVGWGMIEDAIRGDGVLKNLTVKGVIKVLFKQYPDFEGFTINFLSSGPKSGKVRWVL